MQTDEGVEMNSLDKMEDYDRLARLCEKQAQQVIELQAMVVKLSLTVSKNHEWHKLYDEYGGYEESEIYEQNISAITTTPLRELESNKAASYKQGVYDTELKFSQSSPAAYGETFNPLTRAYFSDSNKPLIIRPSAPAPVKEGD
jgi:hypothetical protein